MTAGRIDAQSTQTEGDLWDALNLPPLLRRAARWVERHPRSIVAGALLVAVMGLFLAQNPADATGPDANTGETETPLFI